MKKRISEAVLALLAISMLSIPAYADSAEKPSEEKVNKKTVVTDESTNPNTGAVTLAGVSVALAGAAVIVSKKKK